MKAGAPACQTGASWQEDEISMVRPTLACNVTPHHLQSRPPIDDLHNQDLLSFVALLCK